ncbi:OsmC-like protein [Pelagophyceae sp. CCMP2097]|nr:OsmC-like protein [Pelagophyceae sp. CCMP2097]
MRRLAVRAPGALRVSARRLSADGPKRYTLTTVAEGSTSLSRTATGHDIRTDLPRASGGSDANAEPVYLLLSALAACESATLRYVAFKSTPRVRIARVDFDLSAHRDEAGALQLPIDVEPAVPSRLLGIAGSVRVQTDASESQLAALAKQVHARCPVANMVMASGCKLDLTFIKADLPPRR